MRYPVRSIVGVAALTLTVPLLSAADSPEVPEVEWVIASSDSLEDVVLNALEYQDSDAVAAAVEPLFVAAADDGLLEFPELEDLGAAELVELTNLIEGELVDGNLAPGFIEDAAAEVTQDSGGETLGLGRLGRTFPSRGSTHGLPAPRQIIANGYAYVQNNWIVRGVTDGWGGIIWTDRLNLRWTTNPGAVTSKIDYYMMYFPSGGYFSNVRLLTRATRNGMFVASTGWRAQSVGTTSRYVTNSTSARGAGLVHITEFAATARDGRVWLDQQRTSTASCEPSSNRCRY